jgi:hypothetical protein
VSEGGESMNAYISGFKLETKVIPILVVVLLALVFRRYLLIFSIISFGVIVMLHKRYLNVVLGVDICMMLVLLSSSRFGPVFGAAVGGSSFLIGMIASLEFTKSPLVTFYGTAFYTILGLVFSVFPVNIVYSIPLLLIALIATLFAFGAFVLGAPIPFLIKYVSSNILANFLFIRIFEGLLRLLF